MTRKNFRFLKLASVVVLGGALIWVSAPSAGAQEMGPGGVLISGSGEFRSHCAQCHGADGKGDGPVAAALKVRPADLTMLAKKNGGVYPAEEVTNAIEGTKGIQAHGTMGEHTPMPIWGLTFRASTTSGAGAEFTPQEVKKKVKLLVEYIKSIQEK
jgi:mono/diheme cytochrome c family protein